MICKTKKNYWQQDISKWEYTRAILQGVLLISTISYLFYGTCWCVPLLSPYLIRYMKSWKKQLIQNKKQVFRLQFKEVIIALSAALNVGYSVENALREAWKELQFLYRKQEPILREFQYMMHQLDMNFTIEKVLGGFAERTGDEEVTVFVAVFAMAKRNGGDMIGIIRNAISQIGDKIDVGREINTIMAAKKLEFRIMSVIPLAMIAYLKFSFPGFLEVLYGNVLGICIMTVCLIIYAVSFEIGRRIVEIEV